MDNDFHISNLEKLSNPKFIETLESAPLSLPKKKSKSFFKTIFKHFETKELTNDLAIKILQTIVKVFTNDARLKDFIDENYFLKLPFNEQKYHDEIFNILYFVFITFPSALSQEMVENMKILIQSNPKKSLILLSIYAQHFASLDNPWTIIDLLISEGKYFSTEDISQNYISLLSFLNKYFPEYRDNRSKHCWNQIYQILSSFHNNVKIASACYQGFCSIAEDTTESYQLPIDHIINHLQNEQLQNYVLALLDIAKVPEKDALTRKLLMNLIKIAESNVKATLVLMQLCEFTSVALELINLSSFWMEKELPTIIDSIRLFIVILKHNETRIKIAETPEFIRLMNLSLKIEKDVIIPLDCTIMRRIPLSNELILALSAINFFETFFKEAHESENFSTKHSAFLLTDTLTRFCFTKDMIFMCDWCAEEIMKEGNFAEQATLVAIRLSQFQECKQRMKENHLKSFFKKKQNEGKIKAIETKFLTKSKKKY